MSAPADLIRTFEFEGASLTFQRPNNGAIWMVSAADVARGLGYRSHRQVLTLFDRHAMKFKAGESEVLALRTSDGKSRRMRAFSVRGLLRFALYADTPVAEQFHDFVVDVMAKLESGEVKLVTTDRLAELRSDIERRDAAHASEVAGLRKIIDALAVSNQIGLENNVATTKLLREVISHSGKILSMAKLIPETEAERLERVIEAEKNERRKGQRFLTPPPDDALPVAGRN